jgi:peptidoglycan hydrolase-like protein with peptidoglycan-binding domain
VLVKEASSQLVDIPAVYRTETESVLVEPARSVWKQGRGPVERIDNASGEIMCLVEVPARYETITKTVLDKPASSKTVEVPAVYKTIKVSRLVKPAAESRKETEEEYTTVKARVKASDAGFFWLAKSEDANDAAVYSGREVCLSERPAEFTTVKQRKVKAKANVVSTEIPAEYNTIEVQRLKSPASERRIPIPARTRTVSRQVQESESRLEWRQVLCETNMTADIITSLQRALKREGYKPGPIDGVVGRETMDALEKYQTKENLDRGGITYEALKKLKVRS